MLYLTDRSLEVPLFLQRAANGGFKYPDAPVPLITVAVTSTESVPSWDDARKPTEADLCARREIELLQRQGVQRTEAEKAEQRELKARERMIAKQRKQENILRHRKTFVKHFKWDWEK